MQRVTQAPNIAIATLWVDALRQAGIDAAVQRYYLGAAAGDNSASSISPACR